MRPLIIKNFDKANNQVQCKENIQKETCLNGKADVEPLSSFAKQHTYM